MNLLSDNKIYYKAVEFKKVYWQRDGELNQLNKVHCFEIPKYVIRLIFSKEKE